ncbi:MAG: hypothetical protein IPJ34_34630 [Myxococcales bacterium]|nr:hypothetical protein [Myxococcales bacterium]
MRDGLGADRLGADRLGAHGLGAYGLHAARLHDRSRRPHVPPDDLGLDARLATHRRLAAAGRRRSGLGSGLEGRRGGFTHRS